MNKQFVNILLDDIEYELTSLHNVLEPALGVSITESEYRALIIRQAAQVVSTHRNQNGEVTNA